MPRYDSLVSQASQRFFLFSFSSFHFITEIYYSQEIINYSLKSIVISYW